VLNDSGMCSYTLFYQDARDDWWLLDWPSGIFEYILRPYPHEVESDQPRLHEVSLCRPRNQCYLKSGASDPEGHTRSGVAEATRRFGEAFRPVDEAFARAKLAWSNVTLAYTVEAASGPLCVSKMSAVRYTAGRIIGLVGALRPLRLHHEHISSVMMCIVDRVALLREMEKLSRGGTTLLGGRMDQLWHLLQESRYA
jgi:hypothetical protein